MPTAQPAREEARPEGRADDPAHAPADPFEAACEDQVRRWRLGQRIPAEHYLSRDPDLAADAGRAVELIYTEFLLREELGEAPTLEEFLARFPAFADELRRQVDLHRALGPGLDGFADESTDLGSLAPANGPGDGRESWPDLEGFRIEAELGRGGMGIVFRATQLNLGRAVAIKVIRGDGLPSADAAARFVAEAGVIAKLSHPNLIQIFALGEQGRRPYLVMEFVDGVTLASRCGGTPLAPGVAMRLVEDVASGIAAAHRLGVIHRDLKPSNILLAADGTPKVADFGLAKLLDGDSGLTRTDAILGSPSYMAPEQAEGRNRDVGPAADVYALGAILYELVTGRPPFRAATVMQTLDQVRSGEVVLPSRLQPGLPRDLETICLKCLEKDPARRYASAEALARDLRRCLDHVPILARRTGPAGRLLRWYRRNPGSAGLAAAVFLLLVAVAGVSLFAAVRLATAAEQERRTLYFAGMNLAQQAWEAADMRRVRDLLAPYAAGPTGEDLRSFEWYYWWKLAHQPAVELVGHRKGVVAVAFAPDGRSLASAGSDRVILLWGRRRAAAVASLPAPATIRSLAFAPDGHSVAAGLEDGSILIWRPGAVGAPTVIRDGLRRVMALAFLDARTLASAASGETIELRESPSGRHAGRLDLPGADFKSLAFSPDGRTLASGDADGTLTLWDLRRGVPRATQRVHSNHVVALAYSPDGRTLASGGRDNTIRLWDPAACELKTTLKGHTGNVMALAFAPDGRTLASAGLDGSSRLWSAAPTAGADGRP